MEIEQIHSRKRYDEVMKEIEIILQKSTYLGGSDKLEHQELEILKNLSLSAEQYEDCISLMPINAPSSLTEMIRYKMYEMKLKQKQLATLLEISEARISEILAGKRKINMVLAKKLHSKLNIDANFILKLA